MELWHEMLKTKFLNQLKFVISDRNTFANNKNIFIYIYKYIYIYI